MIFVPSKLGYQISSGSESVRLAKSASLTFVRRRSLLRRGVESVEVADVRVVAHRVRRTASASAVAVHAITSWSPVVSGSSLPVAASTRTRFDRPCSVIAVRIDAAVRRPDESRPDSRRAARAGRRRPRCRSRSPCPASAADALPAPEDEEVRARVRLDLRRVERRRRTPTRGAVRRRARRRARGPAMSMTVSAGPPRRESRRGSSRAGS